MLKPSTVSVARPAAEALTENGIVLVPRSPQYPVAVMSEYFTIGGDFTGQSGNEETTQLTTQFMDDNKDLGEQAEAEFDELVDNMAGGIQRMMTLVRGVVVPVCKSAKETLDDCIAEGAGTDLKIEPFNYHAVHSDPSLTGHLAEHYGNLKRQETYRTFLMDMPSRQTLIDWVSTTRHLDETQVKEWLLELDEGDIENVWYALFDTRREIDPSDIHFLRNAQRPFNIDSVLFAYLLTSYLTAEPQEVRGESVDLSEWETAMAQLHGLMGATLLMFYQRREKDRRIGRLVLKSTADTPYEDGIVHVTVNGDIFGQWVDKGGDTRQLLGAAVTDPTRVAVDDLDDAKQGLIDAWERKYPMIKQHRADKALANRRDMLKTILVERVGGLSSDLEESLPSIATMELRKRFNAEIQATQIDEFDDTWRLITRLVCNLYYPHTPFLAYLRNMDRLASVHKDLPSREVATLAVVEMVAQWLADQARPEAVAFEEPQPVEDQLDMAEREAKEPEAEAGIDADADDIEPSQGEAEPEEDATSETEEAVQS